MSVRNESAEPDPIDELTAEQRGNVSPAHHKLLAELSPSPESEWSLHALRACLEQLRTSTITAAPEVQVELAWTDGPEAFCVIYSPPYGRDMRVGIRRHINDGDYKNYKLGSMSPGYDLGDGDAPDAVAFGETVADFDIGEPLGNVITILRSDQHGVKWWGSLGDELPVHRIDPSDGLRTETGAP